MSSIASVWDEALQRPDDDGVRAVLADMLQASGDPRGELMALQLLPPDDDGAIPRQARIQALLERHHREWLGSLCDIATGVRFHRGMLTRIHFEPTLGRKNKRWPTVLAETALASVEDVLGMGDAYARFIRAPGLGSLRRIELCDEPTIAAFEHMPERLVHVACAPLSDYGDRLFTRAIARCGDMPLTSIAIMAEMLPIVAATPWFERLTGITIGAGVRRGLGLWSHLPRTMSLTIVPLARLDPCSRAFPWDYRVELVHTAKGLVARLSGEWLLQHMSALEMLPTDVARVEIEETSDGIAARLVEAVRDRPCEVITYPARRHGYLTLAS